jgi:hypothetical protein
MVGPTANSPLFTDAGRGPAGDSLIDVLLASRGKK